LELTGCTQAGTVGLCAFEPTPGAFGRAPSASLAAKRFGMNQAGVAGLAVRLQSLPISEAKGKATVQRVAAQRYRNRLREGNGHGAVASGLQLPTLGHHLSQHGAAIAPSLGLRLARP
jgi:hypothetical protein